MAVKIEVAHCGECAYIGQALGFHSHVAHCCRCHRGKHRPDIDGHIEEGECGVALSAETCVVVKIAYHHL